MRSACFIANLHALDRRQTVQAMLGAILSFSSGLLYNNQWRSYNLIHLRVTPARLMPGH